MQKARTTLFVVLAFTAIPFASGWVGALTTADPPNKERNVLMQMKLKSAQKLLEGIAVADFGMIEKHAEELSLISKKAEWQILKTPDYVRFGDEFRRHADDIARKAKDHNLDGAALGYVQVTMDCVNCHKHVREVRVAQR
jgi:hypothetical protein